MSPINYLNKVVEVHIGKAIRYALCIEELPKNRILCFAVTQKHKDGETAYKIFLPNGEYSGYRIDYPCRFSIEKKYVKRRILICSEEDVVNVNELYSRLPSLDVLKKEALELKNKIKLVPESEQKEWRHKYNQITMEITKRSSTAFFSTKEPSEKYSNFKTIPNKKGMSHIYQGGSCSSK